VRTSTSPKVNVAPVSKVAVSSRAEENSRRMASWVKRLA